MVVLTGPKCGLNGSGLIEMHVQVPNNQVPDIEAVRIFLKFVEADSARRGQPSLFPSYVIVYNILTKSTAKEDLNGRYFGGRMITASYFDENRFDRLDLAPRSEDIGGGIHVDYFGLRKRKAV